MAKGIKSFKKGMAEDDEPKPMPRTIENEATNPDRSKVG
jgi:sec-independent protein translocase protein TatA